MSRVLIVVVLLSAVCIASDPPTAPAPRAADDRAAKLVEQLGADEFADREAAQKALAAMGTKATTAVRAGLKSENPEIVNRCREVLPLLRRTDWMEVRDAFAKEPAKYTHPVLAKLKEIVGDEDDARELFKDLLADQRSFLAADDAVRVPKDAERFYREALARLAEDYKRWFLSGNKDEPIRPITSWQPARGMYQGVLFLGTFPGTGAEPSATMLTRIQSAEQNAVWNATVNGIFSGLYPGDKPPPAALLKLYLTWMAVRTNPDVFLGGFDSLGRYGFAQALPLARSVAADRARPALARAHALRYVGRFGTVKDVPLAMALLNDPTEYEELKVQGGNQRAVQVRDLATAVALVLHGRNPVDHGFHQGQGRESLTRWQNFGFPDEFSRTRVLKPAREWLEEYEKERQESPVWKKFQAVAGDDDEAWKLYRKLIANPKRAEMLRDAIGDPKKAAAAFAKECEEIGMIMVFERTLSNKQVPRPPAYPDREVTTHDLAALLFLGTLVPASETGVKGEEDAVINYLLIDGLNGTANAAFGKLFAAWAEPRSWALFGAFNVAMSEKTTAMTPVARRVLTAIAEKKRTATDKHDVLALRFLGLYGTKDDLPLVMKFADDKTVRDSTRGGSSAGPPPAPIVYQVRDVAVAAALELRGQKPADFGFDRAGKYPPQNLTAFGFASDAAREAAHKKAREWLEKKP